MHELLNAAGLAFASRGKVRKLMCILRTSQTKDRVDGLHCVILLPLRQSKSARDRVFYRTDDGVGYF